MLHDSLEKTVKIPVKIVNGKPVFFYGGELPKLREGAIGDLILPAYAVLDKDNLEKLEQEQSCDLLPEGATLLVNIKSDIKSKYVLTHGADNDLPKSASGDFVQVYLKNDLKMKMRGTKTPVLSNCACNVPALENPKETPISLNHAFTLISTKFETKRLSHTGNVFTKMYFKTEKGLWSQLDNLRKSVEADFEQRFVERKIKFDAKQMSAKSEKEIESKIWLAVCELGDYFSQLGGAVRPLNMKESEIFLYVGCLLMEKYSSDFNKDDFLDLKFLKAAQPVFEKTNNYLADVEAESKELLSTIQSFVRYYDAKLENQKNSNWEKFALLCLNTESFESK